RGAVHVDEGAADAGAAVVEDAGEQALPRPGLAEDEHGRDVRAAGTIEGGEMAHLAAERVERGCGADDPLGRVSHRLLEAAVRCGPHVARGPAMAGPLPPSAAGIGGFLRHDKHLVGVGGWHRACLVTLSKPRPGWPPRRGGTSWERAR